MYVPASHQTPREDRSNLGKSFRSSFLMNEGGNTGSGSFKRRSASFSCSSPRKIPFLSDILENRPSTQNPYPTHAQSPDGRGVYFKSRRIFCDKIISPNPT